jgi:hypothetical protein
VGHGFPSWPSSVARARMSDPITRYGHNAPTGECVGTALTARPVFGLEAPFDETARGFVLVRSPAYA